ncbi:hypothetical protein HDV03_003944 [Kappamyces sp. JEL0829]|nr:hypothetical protein HDV03_003944 [Kappamyces sp. JEL0829]KAJ3367900.1 hypothetical protein HDU91_001001 [Kappamyces sp. JEL0680]
MTPGNMEFSSSSSALSAARPLFAGSANQDSASPQPSLTANAASHSSPAEGDKYGMMGLIDVVRMTNPDLSMLALGSDLTGLGLNLNGAENVFSKFMTPFSDTPAAGATSEPSFTLPSAYTSIRPPPPLAKMKALSDETLFYIFYAMPRDVMQEAAAQELYSRSWRFHKEFKLWLSKDPENVEPLQKGVDFERGIYIFFDPATWTRVKLERVLYFDHLEDRVKKSKGSGSLSSQGGPSGLSQGMARLDLGKK